MKAPTTTPSPVARRWRMLVAIARADLLERLRDRNSAITFVISALMGWAVVSGRIVVTVGSANGYAAGQSNSAWIAGNVAMIFSNYLGLVCFFFARGSVTRDVRTGVGEIFGAANLSSGAYAFAKSVSNTLLLLMHMMVFVVAALAMHAVPAVQAVPSSAIWWSFVAISIPTVALVGSLATLWDLVPGLRTGAGNVLWLIAWVGAVNLVDRTNSYVDFTGFHTMARSMEHALNAARPELFAGGQAFVGLWGPNGFHPAAFFPYAGLEWTQDVFVSRLIMLCYAFLASLSATLFVRFGASATPTRRRSAHERRESVAVAAAPVAGPIPTSITIARKPTLAFSAPFALFNELRVMLRGLAWWWYAGAVALIVAGATTPLMIAKALILPLAWIWPILLWSGLGTREHRYGVVPILRSAPHNIIRQLPTGWLAGMLVATAIAAGVGVRFVIDGDRAALVSLFAGACFIPAFALSLGEWTGTSKPFEALYTGLWLLGPLFHTARLDFTGGTEVSDPALRSLAFLGVAALLIVAAALRRRLPSS